MGVISSKELYNEVRQDLATPVSVAGVEVTPVSRIQPLLLRLSGTLDWHSLSANSRGNISGCRKVAAFVFELRRNNRLRPVDSWSSPVIGSSDYPAKR